MDAANRREPDAAVAGAVQSIIKNKNFKRLMLFGLKSLSDYCTPPCNKYQENSIAAIKEGAIPIIAKAVTDDPGDEDVQLCSIKVFFGVVEALKDQNDAQMLSSFVGEGAVDAAVLILNHGDLDDTVLEYVLDFFARISDLGVDVDPAAITQGTLKCLQPRMTPKAAEKCVAALAAIASTTDGIKLLSRAGGTQMILNFLRDWKSTPETQKTIESALVVIQGLTTVEKTKTEYLEVIMHLLDRNKGNRSITQKGGVAMASMLNPQELKRCLSTLAKPNSDTPERNQSLATLTSMSYISSYAEAIVKAGGVPTLCDAITRVAADVAKSNDEKLVHAMAGGCKMLARIVSNPNNRPLVYESKGLDAVSDAYIASAGLNSTSAASCLDCLAAFASGKEYIPDILKRDIFCEMMKVNVDKMKPEFAESVVYLIAAAAAHSDVADKLLQLNVVEFIANIITKQKKPEIIKNGVTALFRLAPRINNLEPLVEQFGTVFTNASPHIEDPKVAASAAGLLETLVSISGAAEQLAKGVFCQTALHIMMEHPQNAAIVSSCKTALEVISRPEDVAAALSDLERCLLGARNNPDKTFKALAAVSGLCGISALKPMFREKDAAAVVMRGIKMWVEGAKFAEQQKLIKAGFQAHLELSLALSEKLEDPIIQMLEVAQIPQMKGIVDKQDTHANNMLDLLGAVREMTSRSQITDPERLGTVLENLMKVMRKYSEQKTSQLSCIQILTELCGSDGGGAAAQIVEGGALKHVIGYAQKLIIHEETHVETLKLLLQIVNVDPTQVEPLKRAGVLDLIRHAIRQYASSKDVQKYSSQLMRILVPAESVEREIHDSLSTLLRCGSVVEGASEICGALRVMNLHVSTLEGARVAARCDFGRVINGLTEKVKEAVDSPGPMSSDTKNMLTELSETLKHITQARVGVAELVARGGGIQTVVNLTESVKKMPESEAKRSALKSCMYTARRLMDGDTGSTDAAISMGVHHMAFKTTTTYPDDHELMTAGCSVVAAMKAKKVTRTPEYKKLLENLIEVIKTNPDLDAKRRAIEALHEFMVDPDDETVEVFCKAGGLTALYELLDVYPENEKLCREVLRCLNALTGNRNMRTLLKQEGEGRVENALAVAVRCAIANGDKEIQRQTVMLVNSIAERSDRATLQQIGLVDVIHSAIEGAGQTDATLNRHVKELLAKLGADELIASLMKTIIDLTKEKPSGYLKSVETTAKKLALYINTDVKDEGAAFGLSRPCCEAMMTAIRSDPDNVGLIVAVGEVTRSLCDRAWSDHDSPYGAKVMVSSDPKFAKKAGEDFKIASVVATYSRMITDTNSPAARRPKFLCTAFRTLAACAENPSTYPATLANAKEHAVVATAFALLKEYQNDSVVTARILEYLALIATTEEGANEVFAQCKAQRKMTPDDVVTAITASIHRNKANPDAVVAGIDLLGNLSAHASNVDCAKLKSEKLIFDIERLAAGNPAAVVSSVSATKRIADRIGDDSISLAQSRRAVVALNMAIDDPSISSADRMLLTTALAKKISQMTEERKLDEIQKAGGVDALINALAEATKANDIVATVACTRALEKLAKADADVGAQIARYACPMLMDSASLDQEGSAQQTEATLSLFKAIVDHEGNGRLLASNALFKNYLTDVSNKEGQLGLSGVGMAGVAAAVMKLAQEDNPDAITLEAVYNAWKGRVDGGQELDLRSIAVVAQQLDFVMDYTFEYGTKTKHKSEDETLGRELMFGCKCIELLCAVEANIRFLTETFPPLFLGTCGRQTDEQLLQHMVLAARRFVDHADGVNVLATTKRSPETIAVIIDRGRTSNLPQADKESLLIPRLELAEKTAINRTHYNNTPIMAVCINLWDDFDKSLYTSTLLRHVFRSMRKIINDSWLEIIMKNSVPKRLIAVVQDKGTDSLLLPDVLFLLGTLAVVPEIKTQIGDLKGVEHCLDLLSRSMKLPIEESAAVQTNSCLALANITGSHRANIQRFVDHKGLELNVTALGSSIKTDKPQSYNYDVANAGSVLMCNLCFRRDDIKQKFGEKGACTAVMETIRRYDNTASPAAFRCLASMFKAIANLALFTPNVQEFLKNGVEQTFAHFYKNSDFLPDDVLEASLRTMSNLVLENTEGFMKQFSVVLEPLLYMLKQGFRTSIQMFSLCFEILGNLCRLPANAEKFSSNDGIPTVLKILNSVNDPALYPNGIYVLGIQTTYPSSIITLVNAGVYNFLISVFENHVDDNSGVERTISALRSIRRILQNEPAAKEFVAIGGVNSVVTLLSKVSGQAMIHLEGYRILISLLVLHPPPPTPVKQKNKIDDEFSGDVGVEVEEWINKLERIDRPMGPRSWQQIGLDADVLGVLLTAVCGELSLETNAAQMRLQRCGLGLLAYLACEKMPSVIDLFLRANIWMPLKKALESFEFSLDITYTCCVIAVNVLYMTDNQLWKCIRVEMDFREFCRNLEDSVKGMGKKLQPQRTGFCRNLAALMTSKDGTPDELFTEDALRTWEYDMSLTNWEKDSYPNGVQDLPQAMKDALRVGGKAKIYVEEKNWAKEEFFWKSSQDMLLLQWRADPKEGATQHACLASRMKGIFKGIGTESAIRGAAKGKVSGSSLVGVACGSSEEFPNGVELNIICSSGRSRNQLAELLTEWREAAAYGF